MKPPSDDQLREFIHLMEVRHALHDCDDEQLAVCKDLLRLRALERAAVAFMRDESEDRVETQAALYECVYAAFEAARSGS